MPRPPAPLHLDIAQLEGWVNALADQFADRVLERIKGRLADPKPTSPPTPIRHGEPRLLRLPEVLERVALSKSTLYARVRDGTFPKPRRLGTLSAWLESEVEAWIANTAA